MARTAASALGVVVLATATQVLGQVSIQVNPAVQFQTITGWEATAQAGQEVSPAFENYKDELFDRAIDELGITRIRLEVRSGAEYDQDNWSLWMSGQIDYATWRSMRYATVNDNADPHSINFSGFYFSGLDDVIAKVVQPLRQRMQDRNRHLFVNLNYVAFTNQIGSGLDYGHDDSPEEYAEFVEATYLHMQNTFGFVPDAWEVILEPDNTSFWRGQQIGEAIVAAAARLESHGFTPRFIVPSTANMGSAASYFDDMIAVPGVLPYVEEISYHRYGGVSDTNLQAIALRGQQYGLNTAMLEHIGSGYVDLHKDLKMGNVSAWEQFTLAYPTNDNGAQYFMIDDSDPNNPQVTMGQRSKFLSQYFRYVREGAVRVDATTGDSDFDPVTFINSDGLFVAVIKAAKAGTFAIDGLPAGLYGISYTTEAEYNVSLPDVTLLSGEALTASIPSDGVMTVYGIPEPFNPDILDITPFIFALTHPEDVFEAMYPDWSYWNADVNGDGNVDSLDITPFVRLLTGGGQAVPEPATLGVLAASVSVLLKRKRKSR